MAGFTWGLLGSPINVAGGGEAELDPWKQGDEGREGGYSETWADLPTHEEQSLHYTRLTQRGSRDYLQDHPAQRESTCLLQHRTSYAVINDTKTNSLDSFFLLVAGITHLFQLVYSWGLYEQVWLQFLMWFYILLEHSYYTTRWRRKNRKRHGSLHPARSGISPWFSSDVCCIEVSSEGLIWIHTDTFPWKKEELLQLKLNEDDIFNLP